jgi:hypothetical protein
MKLIAIYSGGDWSDASCQHLILPDGMDINSEQISYDVWYRDYYKSKKEGIKVEWQNFATFLIGRGATEPGPEILEEVWDD